MPTLIVTEFNSVIAGFGVYPMGTSGNSVDFSTGTERTMDLNDGDNYFGDIQQSAVSDQTLISDFVYSNGTIAAGIVITSAGKMRVVSADGTSTIDVGYIRLGSWPDVKQLLVINVVSGTFDPNATYISSGSYDANGGFEYACFLRGTHISTSIGDVMIEQLHVGDLVLTQDRGLQPIRWIGSQKVPQQVLDEFSI